MTITLRPIHGTRTVITAVECNALINHLKTTGIMSDQDTISGTEMLKQFDIDCPYFLHKDGYFAIEKEVQYEGYSRTEIIPVTVLIPEMVKVYVNVYLYDRAYGGSEEGGWWYDTYEAIDGKECLLTEVPKVLEEFKELYPNAGRRSVDSVLSEGQYAYYVEARPGVSTPLVIPSYC